MELKMIEKSDLREGFYLDEWRIEPRSGRISNESTRGQIEPKIMDVLVLLAENYPEVVQKKVFFDSVWHDVNVVEHVLSRAISEIRRVLSDDPREPKFIETLPKIGYRLMKPPIPLSADRAAYREAPLSIDARRAGFSHLASFVGGGLAVLLLIVTGILLLSSAGIGHH